MSGSVRIVAFGDSITNGVGLAGVTEADTFRDIMRRELSETLGATVEVVNAGVNGDIVTLALGRLQSDVLDRKRDVAAEKRVELVDVYRAFEENPDTRDYFPDGLHPDARGHRLIGDLLVKRITRIWGTGSCRCRATR